MAADTRIFRITRRHTGELARYTRERSDTVEYGNRRVASSKCGSGGYSYRHGSVVKVEATNADATEGWTDVTEEFLGE